MRAFSWLRGRVGGRPPVGPGTKVRSARRLRPRLEALDDRWVPSTLAVTSPLDDASQHGTLRWAVAHASDGDTILLTPAVGAAGITLTRGELLIQHNVTITGVSNSNPVTISGGRQSRVFEIAGGASVTLSDLTVTDGNGLAATPPANPTDPPRPHEDRGGGVVVDEGATLTITGSTVIGNSADRGGGIADFGTLTVTGCTVTGNHATGAYGGGISVFSGDPFSPPFTATATITDSAVSGNTALENGGGIVGVSSTVTVDHCVVTGNTATKFNGGGLNNHFGIMTVSHSRVDDNKVPRSSEGGGLFNDGIDWTGSHFVSTLTVIDCDVDGNSAGFGAGVYNAGTLTLSDSRLTSNFTMGDWGYGGGVLTDYRTTAALQNDVITGNSANFGGGVWSAGTTTISASRIDNNTAAGAGGGIITEYGSLTVENSEINNNDNSTGWGGGGLFVDYGTVTLSHCDISGNSTGSDGGGIFNWDTLTLTDCTLSGNTAGYSGGGIYNPGSVSISACAISDNTAAFRGGGIDNDFGTMTVEDSTVIVGNHAPVGFGADVYNLGVLNLDGSSSDGILNGHPAIPI
jgi:hypothetical protein